MEPISLRLIEKNGIERTGYLIEQGIPVMPTAQDEVKNVRLMAAGEPVPAEVQVEATDAQGNVRWLMVTAALDLPASATREFTLESSAKPANVPQLRIDENGSQISISSDDLSLQLSGKDEIELAFRGKSILSGKLAFSLMHDSRTFVAGVRTIYLRPSGFKVEERSESRCLVVWKARMHPDVYREYSGIDERRYIDCELEMRVYAASPVIRLKWTFTNNFYYPASLQRYALALPIAPDSKIDGEWDGAKFGSSVRVDGAGGPFVVTAPFVEDIGKGAGIGLERLEWVYDEPDGFSVENATPDELPASGDGTKPSVQYLSVTRPPVIRTDYRLTIGGINPPPDEGAGGDNPQIHRTFLQGSSRSFESSLILHPADAVIQAEMNPVYFTVGAQHYSNTEVLPERGDEVTLGDYALETVRSADWLVEHQWRSSLYYGEWWREYDLATKQGVEEAGSGNSSLGAFYHYLRTGDDKYLACAKRSMMAIYDLTMNKQETGIGPFIHTRRFLFDAQNWHHPRYQRVAGMMRPSHVFCDRRMRKRACQVVRWFAEHYMDTDGAPMASTGRNLADRERCTESAMAQFCESLILAYHETGDEFFLEKAKLQANWVVEQMEAAEDTVKWMCNWNIQFVCRGLLAVALTTGEQRFKDAYVKICRNILHIKPEHAGYKDLVLWEVHFVVYFAWHFAEAHKLTGDDNLIRDYIKILNEELKRQDDDGSFPYVTSFVPRLSQWNSYYDQKTCAAYLPVVAARMKAIGMNRKGERN